MHSLFINFSCWTFLKSLQSTSGRSRISARFHARRPTCNHFKQAPEKYPDFLKGSRKGTVFFHYAVPPVCNGSHFAFMSWIINKSGEEISGGNEIRLFGAKSASLSTWRSWNDCVAGLMSQSPLAIRSLPWDTPGCSEKETESISFVSMSFGKLDLQGCVG